MNDELRSKFLELKEKIDFLNNKSKSSLENTVGINDVIFCWCVFGENMNELRRFYHEYGFPKNDGVVLSKLWRLDSLASSCRFALSKLEKNLAIDDSEFLEERAIGDLFYELLSCCCSGDYECPVNSNVLKLKRMILYELMDIAYGYWCSIVEQRDLYDDNERLEKIQEYYQIYKDYAGVQCRNYKIDESGKLVCVYEGAQFGNEIENLFDYINKCSKLSDRPKKLEKK